MFSNKDRKLLFNNINKLSSTEHEEIYRMVTESDANVSKNKNGVFFNLSSISNETVKKIDAFVSYCLSNQDELDEYDKRLNECKINNKYTEFLNIHGNHDESQINIDLENLSSISNCVPNVTSWQSKMDSKSTQKIMYLLERMHDDRDNLHNKKSTTKFMNAKKKYSKRIDKKFDFDLRCELETEPYII